MTHLRRMMLEELQRRNYAPNAIHAYLHSVEVEQFARPLRSEDITAAVCVDGERFEGLTSRRLRCLTCGACALLLMGPSG